MFNLFIFLIVGIIVIGLIMFYTDLQKDNYDLSTQPLNRKFSIVVDLLNEHAYKGEGVVREISKRAFSLYKDPSNQLIQFLYSTGHLTIIWKYKYFQKEVVHERQFNNVRNLSIFEQGKIAETMINEMESVIANHKMDVLGVIR
jgi:hypothetical protein